MEGKKQPIMFRSKAQSGTRANQPLQPSADNNEKVPFNAHQYILYQVFFMVQLSIRNLTKEQWLVLL